MKNNHENQTEITKQSTKMLLQTFRIILATFVLISVNSLQDLRRDFNSHIVMKQLATVEITENIPIGHTIIDLAKTLEDTRDR